MKTFIGSFKNMFYIHLYECIYSKYTFGYAIHILCMRPTYYIDNRFTLSSKLKKVPIPKKTRKVVA